MKDQKQTPIGERQAPPSRRLSETRKIAWQPPSNPDAPETTIFVTIGYQGDGLTPLDIFYDSGYRSGSDLEALVSDICIILSVFLQHSGVDLTAFAKSVSSVTDLHKNDEVKGSLVGVFLEELQKPPLWVERLGCKQS